MIRDALAIIAVGGLATGCGASPQASPITTETVTVTESAAPSTSSAEPDSGAQWVETHDGGPGIFSVNLATSQHPAIDPGLWVGTAREPDPNVVVPCVATQWAGEDRQKVVSVWATPIGEDKIEFTIAEVPGVIQLVGDCDWSGGADEAAG